MRLPRFAKPERAAVITALSQYIAQWDDGKRRPTAGYYAAIRALGRITRKTVKVRNGK